MEDIHFDIGNAEWVKTIEFLERAYRKKLRSKAIAYVYTLWQKYAPKKEQKDFDTICKIVNYSLMIFEGEEKVEVNNTAKEILKSEYNIKIN